MAGLLLLAATPTVSADVVNSGFINLFIPDTDDGLYVNLVNGEFEIDDTPPVGWDINIYAEGGLGFFAINIDPVTDAGFRVSASETVERLTFGSVVGPSSTFEFQGIRENSSQWLLDSSDNYFGFRFYNEATEGIHYGWGRIALGTAIDGENKFLVEYAYESTPGLAITIIPEPSSLAMILVALAGMGFAVSRRKRV